MTGDLSACKSKRTLIQLLTINKPLFLALLPGNKSSRFDLLLLFVIFSFLLVFLFASMKDRLGDQRGGSEWEPIKNLLEGD
jgi:amino acid transporter